MGPCASDNTACTNWNVDTSKLPAPIATTTTKVTTTTTKAGTTTKATTTTTTSHTASPSWVIVPGHFILLTIVLLNMML